MRVQMAHLRERAVTGGWVNFAVFDADAVNQTSTGRAQLLTDLTRLAIANGLKVDQSALAFVENGRIKFYGTSNLVDYLSKGWSPKWTHTLDV